MKHPYRALPHPAICRNASGVSLRASLFMVALVLTLSIPPTTYGSEPVAARYNRVAGDTVNLRIEVGKPSPSSLILEQYLPRGTKMVSCSPPARQTGDGRVVKWLFKSVSPGAIDVQMQVSPAASARNVSGVVRYRMPGGGGMREIRVGR